MDADELTIRDRVDLLGKRIALLARATEREDAMPAKHRPEFERRLARLRKDQRALEEFTEGWPTR